MLGKRWFETLYEFVMSLRVEGDRRW